LRRYVVCSRLTLIIINNHVPPYLNTHLSSNLYPLHSYILLNL
jgi:hypothetical protein